MCICLHLAFNSAFPLSYKHPKGKINLKYVFIKPTFLAAYVIEKWLVMKSLMLIS